MLWVRVLASCQYPSWRPSTPRGLGISSEAINPVPPGRGSRRSSSTPDAAGVRAARKGSRRGRRPRVGRHHARVSVHHLHARAVDASAPRAFDAQHLPSVVLDDLVGALAERVRRHPGCGARLDADALLATHVIASHEELDKSAPTSKLRASLPARCAGLGARAIVLIGLPAPGAGGRVIDSHAPSSPSTSRTQRPARIGYYVSPGSPSAPRFVRWREFPRGTNGLKCAQSARPVASSIVIEDAIRVYVW